ncbi:DNA cytosine methyltransferase [Ideonella sp.]|uniref:DNA cytosine methyltransferase n=1 Tax=Ideonella sp. TaxID=1929293 RepID=UPI003BB72EE4
MAIPVIDLFAGPGGLGEGFSRSSKARFDIVVSVEKDGMAFETLQLRAAHRALARSDSTTAQTWQCWDRVVMDSPWNIVFDNLMMAGNVAIREACLTARAEAWNIEMGPTNRHLISAGIRSRLAPHMIDGRLPDNAVLIGGPPCQAYSVVGRARNKGKKDYKAENDHRHFLYREYLAVINEFRPAVFVMENVKGILTSKVDGGQIFETISNDLRRPDLACDEDTSLEYVLVALPAGADFVPPSPLPDDYIVRAELFGIPQARHRVIICGVRKDVFDAAKGVEKLQPKESVTVREVIGTLPELRPEVSHRGRGTNWLDALQLPLMKAAIDELHSSMQESRRALGRSIQLTIGRMSSRLDPGRGLDRSLMSRVPPPAYEASWYQDRPIGLLTNHESRSHMPEDIARYFFVAMHGQDLNCSPRLDDFPVSLLPKHANVDPSSPHLAIFKDRFRVQTWDRHSMTVTSHIGKDGHAFIHPDPLQCRSLTVREAARLQTFPDSYVFLGNRTSQYTQVGNAVPPMLALRIADIVAIVLDKWALSKVPPAIGAGRS